MQITKLQDKDLEAFYGGHPPEVSAYSPEELAWMGEEDRETFTRPVFSMKTDAPVAKKRGRPTKKK
jgi:hypothetical protein